MLEDDDPSFTIYLETLKIDPNTIFLNPLSPLHAIRPLYYTIRNENYFATEMLLQYGADPNLSVDGNLLNYGMLSNPALIEAMRTHNVVRSLFQATTNEPG